MKRRQFAAILMALILGAGSALLTGCASESTYYTHNIDRLDRNGDVHRDYGTQDQKVGDIPENDSFVPIEEVLCAVRMELPAGVDRNSVYAIVSTNTEQLMKAKEDVPSEGDDVKSKIEAAVKKIDGYKDDISSKLENTESDATKEKLEGVLSTLDSQKDGLNSLSAKVDAVISEVASAQGGKETFSFKFLRINTGTEDDLKDEDEAEFMYGAELPKKDSDGNMMYYPQVKLKYTQNGSVRETGYVSLTDHALLELSEDGELSTKTYMTYDDSTPEANRFPSDVIPSNAFTAIEEEISKIEKASSEAYEQATGSKAEPETSTAPVEESSEPAEESSEPAEESSETEEESSETEEESSETEESSDEPSDENVLAVLKVNKPEEWSEEDFSVVLFEGDVKATVKLEAGDDGLYTASIPKTNDKGEEFTSPKFKFHSKIKIVVETQEIALDGSKTYNITGEKTKWTAEEV